MAREVKVRIGFYVRLNAPGKVLDSLPKIVQSTPFPAFNPREKQLSEEATVSIEESKLSSQTFRRNLSFFERERERDIRHPAFSAGERYKSVTEMDLLILKMGKATRVIDPRPLEEEEEEGGGRFLDGKEAKAENCSAQRRKSQR